MKWTLLLNLVLVGLVVGDGAWKQNHEYTYKLMTTTLSKLNNQWVGAISRARLSIYPQSESLLIGKISKTESAEVKICGECYSNLNDNEFPYKYNQWLLSKPFEIHTNNGQIHSLSVHRTMKYDQLNQLKFVISQLEVDVSGFQIDVNKVENRTNDAFNMTTTQPYTGDCNFFHIIYEYSTHEISTLPEYLVQPDLVPLPDLKGKGEFINYVKTNYRNNKNCSKPIERKNGPSSTDIGLKMDEVTNIILSGSLTCHTIQSTRTTSKVSTFDRKKTVTISNVSLTLESMEKSTRSPEIHAENLLHIGELNYYNNLLSHAQNIVRQNISDDKMIQFTPTDNAKWSDCYTSFITSTEMCFYDYGPEWEAVAVEAGCGFFSLGHRAKCQYHFPGCESTYCYSPNIGYRCEKVFGDRLPVRTGGFEICSPGFIADRCCPKSYV